MWTLYREFGRRFFASLFKATNGIVSFLTAGIFLAPLVRPELAKTLEGWGISQWWVRLPFLFWFGHLFLESLREMYLEERDRIVNEAKKAVGGISAADAARVDARERLGLLRNALNKHADEAPSGESYTPQLAAAWVQGADLLLKSLAKNARTRFHRPVKTYESLRTSVASLRSIAAVIRVEDLKE